MNGLQVPTDNLYKFMAIAGVVTGLTCTYLEVTLRGDMSKRWYEHLTKYSSIDSALNSIDRDANTSMDQVAEIEKRTNALVEHDKQARSERERREITSTAQELWSATEALRLRDLESEKRSDAVKERITAERLDRDWLKYLDARTHAYSIMLINLALLGYLVSVAGFYLWYARVQKYLDRKMHDEAENRGAVFE